MQFNQEIWLNIWQEIEYYPSKDMPEVISSPEWRYQLPKESFLNILKSWFKPKQDQSSSPWPY